MKKKQPRVFLGLLEVAGFYCALRRGFAELGIDAFYLYMGENTYQKEEDRDKHPIGDFYRTSLERFERTRNLSRFHPGRYLATIRLLASLAAVIAWVAARFDILVFKSGIGFTSSLVEQRLFRLLGKTIVVTFHGSDARPPYLNGGYSKRSAEWIAERTRSVKKHVHHSTRYASYVLDNPLSGHFHERWTCIAQCIGNPIDPLKLKAAESFKVPEREDNSLRILHAPSNPAIKGSDAIREAVDRLKARGYAITYVAVTNVPNETVMQEIMQCDFVVDEIYSDTHGAMFSLEAAMLGKPSIVCGYGKKELDRFIPEEAVVPTYFCHPDELEQAIEKLVQDRAFREELAKRAKSFAERRASAPAVAERLLRVATGNAPANWFFDPHDLNYFQGLGGTEEQIRETIRRLIAYGGVEALQVGDKPELEQRLVAFANDKPATAVSQDAHGSPERNLISG